jgi:hypothetical protein
VLRSILSAQLKRQEKLRHLETALADFEYLMKRLKNLPIQ